MAVITRGLRNNIKAARVIYFPLIQYDLQLKYWIPWLSFIHYNLAADSGEYEIHETCPSVTFYYMIELIF